MAKTTKSNKKHYATPQEKAAQRKRTKANKIRKLTQMLEQNPSNVRVQERLKYWQQQTA